MPLHATQKVLSRDNFNYVVEDDVWSKMAVAWESKPLDDLDLKCFKKSNYRIQQELKIDLLNFKVLLCTRDYHNVINDKIDDTSDNNKRIFAVKAKNKTTAEYWFKWQKMFIWS